ncbi:MAG: tRNA 2-thiouridine(34) synthase MnmA [Deltaproteobacteria bacterium]|nr:tRNA 2-thiouridine(34) synthase MnmA [Deltaproteobacteria bacterium]
MSTSPPHDAAALQAGLADAAAVRAIVGLAVGSPVAVAMSGGVDSSAVAGLLVEAGYRVFGLTARLYDVPAQTQRPGSCCAPDDARDARAVTHHLGIRHYVIDEREAFLARVVQPFVDAWAGAETPNPCVHCNRSLKFDALLGVARDLGAAAMATGHYARLLPDGQGGRTLHRARDPSKDQAYFLYPLVPQSARALCFPLGDLTKAQVRAHASRLGLATASKRESMDVCFIGGQRPQDWLGARIGTRPGPVVDGSGVRVGDHDGLHAVTIGQRHGLRIARATPDAAPTYVVDKRPDGTVVVGDRNQLRAAWLHIAGCTWVGGVGPKVGDHLTVQVRHRGQAVPCTVTQVDAGGTEVVLRIDGDLFAAARGQAGVLFTGDQVVGGGTIRSARQGEPGLADG